jgi:hypothetical protein
MPDVDAPDRDAPASPPPPCQTEPQCVLHRGHEGYHLIDWSND